VSQAIKPAAELSTEELVNFLMEANAAYRSGQPLIDDATYDQVYRAELEKRDPEHEFLNSVEPELETISTKKVRHLNPLRKRWMPL